MAARRRDLQRPLGAFLPLHVAEVGQVGAVRPHGGLGARHQLRALEVVGELDQRPRRQHVQVAARPGGLRAAGRGADQPVAGRIGRHRGRQHARHGRDGAVERQLPQHREAAERVRRDRPDGRHDAERDGQVVVAALLREVGGSEVDGDPLRRQRQARRRQGRAHPLARFRDGLVAEADDVEHHGAVGDLHLDVDRPGLDALEGDRRNPHDHRALADAIQDGRRLARGRPRRKAPAAAAPGRCGRGRGAPHGRRRPLLPNLSRCGIAPSRPVSPSSRPWPGIRGRCADRSDAQAASKGSAPAGLPSAPRVIFSMRISALRSSLSQCVFSASPRS